MVFLPGNNANPKGRPIAGIPAREAALALVPAAFKALRKALTRPGERVAAANIILDRAYGKVQANVALRVIASMRDLSDGELLALAGETEEALALDGTVEEAAPIEIEESDDDEG